MPAQPETVLSVRFETSGAVETNIKDWSIESDYLLASDGFHFTLFSQDKEKVKRLELQGVELLVNGASQLIGRIEKTERGGDGSAVRCSGRDYMSELVECNVDPYKKIAENTELALALLEMMRPVGVTQIMDWESVSMQSIRTGKPIKGSSGRKNPRAKKAQDLNPDPGEGIYQFCERLVTRHAVTLQPGPSRSAVVLDAPDYKQDPQYTLTRTDDPTRSAANNIRTGTATRAFDRFPTYALFTGTGKLDSTTKALIASYDMVKFAQGFNSELGEILLAAIQVGRSQQGDPNVLYRLLCHRDQNARDQEQLEACARRAIAERLKDTLSYECTVVGHTDPKTGAVYSINTMANVEDSIADVHEPLWIASRKLEYGAEGPLTRMQLWRPESFQIGAEE